MRLSLNKISLKKISLFLVFAVVSSTGIFALDSEIRPLRDRPVEVDEARPERSKELDEEETAIEIKTDVSGVDVYLNGIYYGKSDVVIRDLRPGYYRIELRKNGYERERYYIHVRRGYSVRYYFNMRRIYGIIAIHDLPSDAYVYMSQTAGSSSVFTHSTNKYSPDTYTTKVDPGYYEVRVRRFGYEDFVQFVEVYPYETSPVFVDMYEADFELTDFACSKNRFNPKYKNLLGKTEFTFKVTASEPVECTIFNQNDETVCFYEWADFNTWNQSFYWDGKTKDGETLPDGSYTALLSSENFEYKLTVELDSSISYPIVSSTKVGSGIGNLPAVFRDDSSFLLTNIQVAPELILGNAGGLYDVDISAGFIFNFAHHYEFNLSTSLMPSAYLEDTFFQLSTGLKLYNKYTVNPDMDFCYGGLLRYGFVASDYYKPIPFDNGAGLGFGLLCALDTNKYSLGYSAQFTFGGLDGNLYRDDELLVNGITFSYKITDLVRLNAWTALNSYGHLFSHDETAGFNMFNGLNVGGELAFMMENVPIIMNIKVDGKILFNELSTLSGTFGFSYMF